MYERDDDMRNGHELKPQPSAAPDSTSIESSKNEENLILNDSSMAQAINPEPVLENDSNLENSNVESISQYYEKPVDPGPEPILISASVAGDPEPQSASEPWQVLQEPQEVSSESSDRREVESSPVWSQQAAPVYAPGEGTPLFRSADAQTAVNSEVHKTEQKKKRMFRGGRKLVAACLVAAVAGVSVGAGLGIGQGVSDRYLQPQQPDPVSSFTYSTPPASVNQTALLSSSEPNVALIVSEISDSVVSINLTGEVVRFFNQVYPTKGAGSGIIFAEDNDKVYIVTNYHVIDEAQEVSISVDDEKMAPANYVGGDSQSDIAVISVEKSALEEVGIDHYSVAEFADSDEILVGETVLAIGNALGEGKTVTRGIVSALKKQTSIQDKTLDVIQTDAAINEGNSGGPLVNMEGKVVGINTAKLTGNGVEGMGYSIPANTVRETAEEILSTGSVDRPYLGITGYTITDDIKRMYNLPSGVMVNEVVQGGSASQAGLITSDIIIGFGETKIETMEDLQAALTEVSSGDTVKLYIYRNGNIPLVLEVTLQNMNAKF